MEKLPDVIIEKDIKEYLREYNPGDDPDYTPSSQTIKTNKNGILFYYREVLGKRFIVKIKRKEDKTVF